MNNENDSNETSEVENYNSNDNSSNSSIEKLEVDTTYQFNKEQLENKWEPNTGIYFTQQEEINNKKKKIKKDKKTIGIGKLITACVASAMIAVLASTGVMYGLFKGKIEDKYLLKSEYAASSIETTLKNISTLTSEDTTANNSDETYTVSQVAKAVLPSVVSITSTSIVNSNYNPFLGGGSYQVTGAGSGIIIGTNDTELLLVTNNHVVSGTTSLTVEFSDGTTVDTAYVKGTNLLNDIAVVAIKLEELEKSTLDEIKIAVLGESDDLTVGEEVIAIGNSLGYGQSVTSGVVSALNRTIKLDSGDISVVQTDASINGGNSGGALVNMRGEVIGINVAKASSSSSSSASVEGMGYAIPISEVKDIIKDLMNKETQIAVSEEEKGYMGLTGYVEVDTETSNMYKIPVGVYIRGLVNGGPLENEGISEGDVITAINGDEVKTYNDVLKIMQYYAKGDEIKITISVRGERTYNEKEISVKLISKGDLEKLIDNE